MTTAPPGVEFRSDATLALRTYRFVARLPNRRSHRRLERVLEQCRRLYNDGLTIKKMAYEYLGLTVVNGRTTVVQDRRRRVPRRVGAGWRPHRRREEPEPNALSERIAGRLAVQLSRVGLPQSEIALRVNRGVRWVQEALADPRHRDGRLAWTPEAVANLGYESALDVPARPWPEHPIDMRSCYLGMRGFNKGQPVPLSLSRWLTELQATRAPELQELERHIKIGVYNRLDRAMAGFFRRVRAAGPNRPGFPAYLRPGEFRTLDLEVGRSGMRVRQVLSIRSDGRRGRVRIKGLPPLTFAIDRPLPGRHPNVVRVNREAGGRITVMLVYQQRFPPRQPRHGVWRPERPVGIHLGLASAGQLALVTADGPIYNRYESRPPGPSAAAGVLQRRRRRAGDGGDDDAYGRSVRGLYRLFRRQALSTQGWQHRLSTDLVRQHDFIAVDNVDVVEAARSLVDDGRRERVQNSGLGGIRRMLDYKGAVEGTAVVRVEPEDEYRRCSRCGELGPEPAGAPSPMFRCSSCSYMTRREENAARNVLMAGLVKLQSEQSSQ